MLLPGVLKAHSAQAGTTCPMSFVDIQATVFATPLFQRHTIRTSRRNERKVAIHQSLCKDGCRSAETLELTKS